MFTLPKVIFHYCDLNAFLCILRFKKIWMSNSYLMNDSFENKWINQYIHLIKENFPSYKQIIERIIRSYESNPEVPYISCFSSNGDLLSQWRAYADDGNGVAIGFNTEFFNHVEVFDNPSPSGNPIILSPVIYDIEEQKKLIKRIFEIVIEQIEAGQKEEDAHQVGHTALKRVSMICKNPAFREEGECRLIYIPYYPNLTVKMDSINNDPNLQNLPIQFRAKKNHLVSYFEFDISQHKGINPINSMIFGPKNTISDFELKAILKEYDLSIKNIYKSSISYR